MNLIYAGFIFIHFVKTNPPFQLNETRRTATGRDKTGLDGTASVAIAILGYQAVCLFVCTLSYGAMSFVLWKRNQVWSLERGGFRLGDWLLGIAFTFLCIIRACLWRSECLFACLLVCIPVCLLPYLPTINGQALFPFLPFLFFSPCWQIRILPARRQGGAGRLLHLHLALALGLDL